ncbi:hypothetical protein MT158_001990 [Salmonella bongori]|nr:hypothetical protein [Salmonella bongori]EJB3560297.1 hypothetical protein [Salmonella bongori]QQP77318.1 hypothetical protein JG560_13710 [Salmonella bongori]QUZ61070.1 hypothetical protein JYN33_13720 [Salmonella bongori CFSAN000510]
MHHAAALCFAHLLIRAHSRLTFVFPYAKAQIMPARRENSIFLNVGLTEALGNKQNYSQQLTALSGLEIAKDKLPFFNSNNSADITTLTKLGAILSPKILLMRSERYFNWEALLSK